MYLPKHQYTRKTIDQLGAFLKLQIAGDGNLAPSPTLEKIQKSFGNYETEVILTSSGKIFSTEGIDFDKGDFTNAIELVEVSGNSDPTLFDNDQGNLVKALKLPPTSEDRKKGIMQRCFYRNKCNGKLKEISKVQFLNLVRNTTKCEELARMNWIIKGPIKDQTINGYVLEGVESRNKKSLEELKKIMPGVETIVTSPLEYVEDIFIPSAKEIQPQNRDIVIPAPSKKL